MERGGKGSWKGKAKEIGNGKMNWAEVAKRNKENGGYHSCQNGKGAGAAGGGNRRERWGVNRKVM